MLYLMKLLSMLPLMVLFFDYAIAMERVEPAGTRRTLRIIAGQTDAGTFPTLKVNWETGVRCTDCI